MGFKPRLSRMSVCYSTTELPRSMSAAISCLPCIHRLSNASHPVSRHTNSASSVPHSAGVATVTTTTAVVTAMRPASPTTSSSPLSSPCASPSSACNHGDSTGQATSATSQAVGINDWLKTIRLHKYTDCLGSYTFEQVRVSFLFL